MLGFSILLIIMFKNKVENEIRSFNCEYNVNVSN